jgi:hypothetical protein
MHSYSDAFIADQIALQRSCNIDAFIMRRYYVRNDRHAVDLAGVEANRIFHQTRGMRGVVFGKSRSTVHIA